MADAELTISPLRNKVGYVVHGYEIRGRKSDRGKVIFGGVAIFDAKKVDGHYVLMGEREQIVGVENDDRPELVSSRLYQQAKEYARKIKRSCRLYTNVQISEDAHPISQRDVLEMHIGLLV